jgi:hypothetical protein
MAAARRRAAVVATAAVTALGLGTMPAFAVSADSVHRGVNGCFAYSYGDPGWFSVTVYYHNRCSTRHRIGIVWDGNSYAETQRNVPANGKGSAWSTSDGVLGVYDLGRS